MKVPEVSYVDDGQWCRLSFTVDDDGPVRPCIHLLDERGMLKCCKFISPDQVERTSVYALKCGADANLVAAWLNTAKQLDRRVLE